LNLNLSPQRLKSGLTCQIITGLAQDTSSKKNKKYLKIQSLKPITSEVLSHSFAFEKRAPHYNPFQYPVNRKFPG